MARRRVWSSANKFHGRCAWITALWLLLASCGGGSGTGAAPAQAVISQPSVQPQSCSPNNPFRFDAVSATTAGSLSREKTWLRDHFDRRYLWYNEVPNVDPALSAFSSEGDVYGSLDRYFYALLTPSIRASGQYKDRFSFTYATREWDQLLNGGTLVGYGIE